MSATKVQSHQRKKLLLNCFIIVGGFDLMKNMKRLAFPTLQKE